MYDIILYMHDFIKDVTFGDHVLASQFTTRDQVVGHHLLQSSLSFGWRKKKVLPLRLNRLKFLLPVEASAYAPGYI